MGWETRRGKRYYYRKVRGEDGRVRSIYMGCGERALQAAREDEARRCATPPALGKDITKHKNSSSTGHTLSTESAPLAAVAQQTEAEALQTAELEAEWAAIMAKSRPTGRDRTVGSTSAADLSDLPDRNRS